MRLSRPVLLMLGAAVVLTSAYKPAVAEGFFQKLFGWGSSRRSERIEPPTFNFGFGGQRLDYGQGYNQGYGYGDNAWPQDYGKYRTLCVRTCDGFYFPIGDSVGRERLLPGCARVLSALRRRGQAVLLPDQRAAASKPWSTWRGAVRTNAERRSSIAKRWCRAARANRRRGRRRARHGTRATRTRRRRWPRCAAARRYAGRTPVPSDGWQEDGDGTGGSEIEAYLQRESDGPQQTPWDGGVRRY